MASHQQIAHRWAQNDENLSLKGFAILVDGRTIFSYGRHFPIARWFVPAARGNNAVAPWAIWFNADGYSVSTAKHKTYVARAIPRTAQVFTLPESLWINCGHLPSEWNARELRAHYARGVAGAVAWYEAQALASYEKAKRARTYADSHTRDAERYLNEASTLAMHFGVPYTVPAFDALKDAAEKRAAENAKAKAKAYKKHAKAFEAGERLTTYHLYDLDGTALVRRSQDGENLETSQGAVVPWGHAILIFRKVKQCVAEGQGWHRNGETLRAGHFQIDSISPDGAMVAGCHKFSWVNMSALAIKEGVFDA